MLIAKKNKLKLALYILILFKILTCSSLLLAKPSETKLQQIKVKNQPLEEVVGLVSQHSNYEILIIGEYDNQRISGIFYLSDLETTLNRIFKGNNTFIEIDNKTQKIIVKLPKTGIVKTFTGIDTSEGNDTFEDLIAMRERERELRLARMNDPAELEPESGLSYVDLIAMREKEQTERLNKIDDPNEIDHLTGMTHKEQLGLREEEREIILAKAENPDEIDPSTGLSYTDQLMRRNEERNERIIRLNSPDETDPDTGLLYRDLLDMRERELNIIRGRK